MSYICFLTCLTYCGHCGLESRLHLFLFISFLLGGFQGGKVLALCGSEVRTLRLRCQTGELRMKVPAQNNTVNQNHIKTSRRLGGVGLICVPLTTSRAVIGVVEHPQRYQLFFSSLFCLFPGRQSLTLLPKGVVTHSSECTHTHTHAQASASLFGLASRAWFYSRFLLFRPLKRTLLRCASPKMGIDLNVERLALML